MWTVIYIAPNSKTAERIQDRLSSEGFLVKVRQINIAKEQFEILVPESELDEVQEVLKDILHSSHRYP
jgi:ribosomal protein S8